MRTCGTCDFLAMRAKPDGKGACMAFMVVDENRKWAHPSRDRAHAACHFWRARANVTKPDTGGRGAE